MVERLRQAEARANALYLDALERRPDAAELCRKGWSELAEKLRAAERTAAEVLKTQGELVEWRAIEQSLAGIHQTVVSGVRSLLGRWAEATGVNLTPAMDETWTAEVDRLFAAMREARFGAHE